MIGTAVLNEDKEFVKTSTIFIILFFIRNLLSWDKFKILFTFRIPLVGYYKLSQKYLEAIESTF
ncbi:hypothetical protein BWD14_01395 [Leptospira santarosai]|uniref:Uncharacterized protein n=1 Tax=Leptospira santarosai TaxID=28183 RepID=A0AB73NAZ9_9LEPT|nr:hypothetical protein BWD14_01395 [Leptospira santarosai]